MKEIMIKKLIMVSFCVREESMKTVANVTERIV